MSYPGKIKIIGGKFKGRWICVSEHPNLRPTPSRIRETLFNWLQSKIVDARCLDCFAGSGVLGIEALSRGAKEVTFIEHDQKIISELKKTLSLFNITNYHLQHQDAIAFLNTQKNKNHAPYDIIFLDPPFDSELLERALDALTHSAFVSPETWIYIELAHKKSLDLPVGWVTLKSKIAGQVAYQLLQYNPFTANP